MVAVLDEKQKERKNKRYNPKLGVKTFINWFAGVLQSIFEREIITYKCKFCKSPLNPPPPPEKKKKKIKNLTLKAFFL